MKHERRSETRARTDGRERDTTSVSEEGKYLFWDWRKGEERQPSVCESEGHLESGRTPKKNGHLSL